MMTNYRLLTLLLLIPIVFYGCGDSLENGAYQTDTAGTTEVATEETTDSPLSALTGRWQLVLVRDLYDGVDIPEPARGEYVTGVKIIFESEEGTSNMKFEGTSTSNSFGGTIKPVCTNVFFIGSMGTTLAAERIEWEKPYTEIIKFGYREFKIDGDRLEILGPKRWKSLVFKKVTE